MLHEAALRYNDLVVRELLKYNAHINEQNNLGSTPLIQAASVDPYFASRGDDYFRDYNEKVIAQLLRGGADVNVANHKGETALLVACVRQNPRATLALLENGTNVNYANLKGLTGLHVSADLGNEAITRLLLSNVELTSIRRIRMDGQH